MYGELMNRALDKAGVIHYNSTEDVETHHGMTPAEQTRIINDIAKGIQGKVKDNGQEKLPEGKSRDTYAGPGNLRDLARGVRTPAERGPATSGSDEGRVEGQERAGGVKEEEKEETVGAEQPKEEAPHISPEDLAAAIRDPAFRDYVAARKDLENQFRGKKGNMSLDDIKKIVEPGMEKFEPIYKQIGAGAEPAAGAGGGKGGEPPKPPRSEEGASRGGKINFLAQLFAPDSISEASKEMATAIRQGRGPAARATAIVDARLSEFHREIKDFSPEQIDHIIHYIENRSKGATLVGNVFTPEEALRVQPFVDYLRDVNEKIGEEIKTIKPDINLLTDYLHHAYKEKDGSDITREKMNSFLDDFVAKQGSAGALKKRTIPTYADAKARGFEPRFGLIEGQMHYIANMNNLIASYRTLDLMRQSGIADYFDRGRQPEGWVALGGNFSEAGAKTLYAPADAARVYNNDISKGFTGLAKDMSDLLRRVNNGVDKGILSLSGYHFLYTTIGSMANDIQRAAFGYGGIGQRLGDIASAATVLPVRAWYRGAAIERAYLGQEEISPHLRETLDLMVKNNALNIKQQEYWKSGPQKDFLDNWKAGTLGTEFTGALAKMKEHPLTGTASVIANGLGKTVDTLAHPMMEVHVPRVKNAALFYEMHDWLRDNPDATPQEKDRKAQSIGNKIDDSFGEMNTDNLFYHKLTKQSLQLFYLSYSFELGGARLLAGGVVDTAKFIVRQDKDLSPRARYLFASALTTAMMSSVYMYMKTGHGPDDYTDAIFPKTGGTLPDGRPERMIWPGHSAFAAHLLNDPKQAPFNGEQPALKDLSSLLRNRDYMELPITNDSNEWYAQQTWNDYTQFVMHESEPISYKTFMQGKKVGSHINLDEAILGIRPAPMEIGDPEAYAEIQARKGNKAWKAKVRADARMKAKYEAWDAE